MDAHALRRGFTEIGQSIRWPERLAVRYRDRHDTPGLAPPDTIFAVLLLSAIVGLAAYGMTMGLHEGAELMLWSALKAPMAAGAAWAVSLPALYILNSRAGSRLDLPTTTLAALITCSFGAMAMLAGAPFNWFFSVALPYPAVRWIINLLIFAGVGIAMTDTFVRVMNALEPKRSSRVAEIFLLLVGVIGGELMILLNLFDF